MIISDQCDVKNVFEPADWLKDPRLSGAGIHTWQLTLLSVLNWANSKTGISAI